MTEVGEVLELDRRIAAVEHEILALDNQRRDLIQQRARMNRDLSKNLQVVAGLAHKLCWSGPTYAHGPHVWVEDWFGGGTYWCPGASDRSDMR